MLNTIKKHKYSYLFITILSTIGFISGIIYYQIQPKHIKAETKEILNIKEELNIRQNNIIKSLKNNTSILFYTMSVIFIFKNIIFSLLNTYNKKLSIIYTLFYNLPAIIISLILIRISFTIIIKISNYIITKNKKVKREIITQLKKYLIILMIELIYQIIIYIISPQINSYLMTFL